MAPVHGARAGPVYVLLIPVGGGTVGMSIAPTRPALVTANKEKVGFYLLQLRT